MKRMKNIDVVKAFLERDNAKNHSESLYSNGNELINYNTTIAQFINGELIINATKYSVTTSKIQNYIRREAFAYAETTIHVPIGTRDLYKYAIAEVGAK